MSDIERRSFLGAVAGTLGLTSVSAPSQRSRPRDGSDADVRAQAALQIRQQAALAQSLLPSSQHTSNGDENAFPGWITAFTKGLPHQQIGEVQEGAYETLLQALSSGNPSDFAAIARGSGMRLVNPQSAFAFTLEGADTHRFGIPPAPGFSGPEAAAEMVELYWQALARDVPFSSYTSSPIAQAAIQDLNRLSAFRGPASGQQVSPATLFRAKALGALQGPYISQFLWKPIPVNSTIVDQRFRVPISGIDYLTTYSEWLALQTGVPPFRDPQFDPQPRYLYNGRSLAEWVHYDFLYQGFHNAALILLNQGPETILDNNPYLNPTNPYKLSKVETGFATFGAPYICSLLGHASMAALCAAWFQKWCVHRRLRPEEFGGRVHQTKTGAASYPIHTDLLNSGALGSTYASNGTYLLPQSFPEGCPLHPAYPAGHATVAGACSAMLKAFFDESELISDCVIVSEDGLSLVPYDGMALLVGGEIDKLASNIAMGRNFAGIHYRSDAEVGFRLGEDVAIAILQDLVNTVTEDFQGFAFTRLDGSAVSVRKENQGS